MYLTKNKKELAKNIILEKIIPALKSKDLDYKKVMDFVASQAGCTAKEVELIISELLVQNKLKEIHIITIPDNQVDAFVKELKEIESQQKQADQRFEEIEKEFAQSAK